MYRVRYLLDFDLKIRSGQVWEKSRTREENSIKNCILRPQFSRPTICNFRGGEKDKEKGKKEKRVLHQRILRAQKYKVIKKTNETNRTPSRSFKVHRVKINFTNSTFVLGGMAWGLDLPPPPMF